MSIIPKHHRNKNERAARWLAKVRRLLQGAADENASASQETTLPSGSLFSTLYAGSRLSVQRTNQRQ